jgi:uncharacterized iron-regulated membrane protein
VSAAAALGASVQQGTAAFKASTRAKANRAVQQNKATCLAQGSSVPCTLRLTSMCLESACARQASAGGRQEQSQPQRQEKEAATWVVKGAASSSNSRPASRSCSRDALRMMHLRLATGRVLATGSAQQLQMQAGAAQYALLAQLPALPLTSR